MGIDIRTVGIVIITDMDVAIPTPAMALAIIVVGTVATAGIARTVQVS